VTELSRYWERGENRGVFTHTFGLKDIAFRKAGSYVRIVRNFVDGKRASE
jgi:hypothetical protein